jgi:tyrosyl-tRNA synthetase
MNINILDALVACGAAISKGEARRLIEGGGVTVDGVKVSTNDVMIRHPSTIQLGKKRIYTTVCIVLGTDGSDEVREIIDIVAKP